MPPFRRRCASVVTIHDLAFMHFPHLLTRDSAAYYGQVRRAVQSAEQVIAVSEATKRDVRTLLAVDERKLSVIYEAAHPRFRPLDDAELVERTRRQYGLSSPFVLFVGTIEPRKNLTALLRALRELLDRNVSVQLALAGKRGWLSDDVFALMTELRLQDNVRLLGPVPSDDLVALYNAAHALIMPSLYEGFGLPPLEAMACGTPVIVSNVSSLPEVVGGAGLCIPPHDPHAWADAVQRVLADDALRRELRAKGIARAQTFSWERAARETLDVYRKAAQNKNFRF
ncbi:MAG: glycosyltransferase family 4 protein [Chloroflexi bacterium]|nr:glycosyltransferase family 4 protein [Chloroflexota bacterium]